MNSKPKLHVKEQAELPKLYGVKTGGKLDNYLELEMGMILLNLRTNGRALGYRLCIIGSKF